MLPLIYMQGRADVERRVLEGRAILQSSNIAAQHARPASVQTAHKDVLSVPFMFLWHNFVDSGFPERLSLADLSNPGKNKLRQYRPDCTLSMHFTTPADALNQRPGIRPTTVERANYGIDSFAGPN